MLQLDLKARLQNKSWWIGIFSLIILLSQQLGFDLSKYIPSNYKDIINTTFTLLAIVGVTVDTSTNGISDKAKENYQSSSLTEALIDKGSVTKLSIQDSSNIEAILDTSVSSKVIVDNPDNNQSIGVIVNSTSAETPN